MKKFSFIFLTLIFTIALTVSFTHKALAFVITMPNVKAEMLDCDYWLEKITQPNKLIMSPKEIEKFNQDIIKQSKAVSDLTIFPSTLHKQDLLAKLTAATFPQGNSYLNGQLIDSRYYQQLSQQLNLDVLQDQNSVSYGFTVKRTNVRAFPTNDAIFDDPTDKEFELFQETALDPAEPLIILHHNLDGNWLFVQAYNVQGWVPTEKVALAPNKDVWLSYLKEPKFLIVTDGNIRLSSNPHSPELSELQFDMGAKVPLVADNEIPQTVDNQTTNANYVVKLPVRDSHGLLQFKYALIPIKAGVREGYLPYTRANLIKQAFKFQGQRYGWGGLFNSVDCSAYVMDIYRSFGIKLPRNSEDQRNSAGKSVDLQSKNEKEFAKKIKALLPGATLHFPGHVMFYLGEDRGHFYVINSLAACYDSNRKTPEGKLYRININQVLVNDLSLVRASGKRYWECLVVGKQLEN